MASRDITVRPWGFYDILHKEPGYQIKRIHVEADQRISLQSHKHRSEHWYIIQGLGVVEIEEEAFEIGVGDSITIAVGEVHRITAVGDKGVTFFEVQAGDYIGEDDITRFEDDYGRLES